MACEDGQEGTQEGREVAAREGRSAEWREAAVVFTGDWPSSSGDVVGTESAGPTRMPKRSGGTTGHTYFHILPDKNQNNFLLLGYAI